MVTLKKIYFVFTIYGRTICALYHAMRNHEIAFSHEMHPALLTVETVSHPFLLV